MPDHWLTFNTKSMLGGALAGQKKFQEAEPLLIAGYQGMNQREAAIPAAAKIRLTEALSRLIDLYTAWKKPQQAAKWKAELKKRTKPKAQRRKQQQTSQPGREKNG